MWNETIRKKWIASGGIWHRKLPVGQTFNSPCSVLKFFTPSLYPLCTITFSPFHNTISQLKYLCHLVSCLKLISFPLKGGSNGGKKRRQGYKEKKSKEELGNMESSSNPKIQYKHVGGLERMRVCFISLPLFPYVTSFMLLLHYHNGELLTSSTTAIDNRLLQTEACLYFTHSHKITQSDTYMAVLKYMLIIMWAATATSSKKSLYSQR